MGLLMAVTREEPPTSGSSLGQPVPDLLPAEWPEGEQPPCILGFSWMKLLLGAPPNASGWGLILFPPGAFELFT